MTATREQAHTAFIHFVQSHEPKYSTATECLVKDRTALLALYDFPAAHWMHSRTTNPIESTLATVRLRTAKTRRCGSRASILSMVFKLVSGAKTRWRALRGSELIAKGHHRRSIQKRSRSAQAARQKVAA